MPRVVSVLALVVASLGPVLLPGPATSLAYAEPGVQDLPTRPLTAGVCASAPADVRQGHCGMIARARVRGIGAVAVYGDRDDRHAIETRNLAIVVHGVATWWTGWVEIGDGSGCNTHACPDVAHVAARILARRIRGKPGLVVDVAARIEISDDDFAHGDEHVDARYLFACTRAACRETSWVPAVVAGHPSCDVTLAPRDAVATWSCPPPIDEPAPARPTRTRTSLAP
ncbi:MAG TPA: hypothetical protein VHE35_06485 [Kofleriaceae bacterium]|nr:hypothetical protein [Kofleriaceae bacterium]